MPILCYVRTENINSNKTFKELMGFNGRARQKDKSKAFRLLHDSTCTAEGQGRPSSRGRDFWAMPEEPSRWRWTIQADAAASRKAQRAGESVVCLERAERWKRCGHVGHEEVWWHMRVDRQAGAKFIQLSIPLTGLDHMLHVWFCPGHWGYEWIKQTPTLVELKTWCKRNRQMK